MEGVVGSEGGMISGASESESVICAAVTLGADSLSLSFLTVVNFVFSGLDDKGAGNADGWDSDHGRSGAALSGSTPPIISKTACASAKESHS